MSKVKHAGKDPFGLKNIKSKKWYSYLGSIFAGFVNAVGVSLFLVPSTILDSGLSGTSIFLGQVTGWSVSIFIVLLNVPFFLFALKQSGAVFILSSLITILSYSFFNFIFSDLALVGSLSIAEWMFNSLEADVFLCAVFGGLISGIGSGLAIRFGGAMDGVEVMAVNFAKRLNLTVGQFVMVYNVVLYVIACIVTGGIKIGLYSIITYAVGLLAVDFVVEGLDKGKAVTIVTDKGDAVAKAISQQMNRSVTILNAKGYYSNSDRNMLYVVVNRFEIGTITKIVKNVDSVAFLTVTDVADVIAQNDVKFKLRRKKNLNKTTATVIRNPVKVNEKSEAESNVLLKANRDEGKPDDVANAENTCEACSENTVTPEE